MPSILMRALHWTPAEVGERLGLITLIVPTTGALLGGALMDAIAKSGRRVASFHVAIYLYAIVSPMLLIALLTHSDLATAILLAPTYMGSVLPLVVGSSIISLITPPRMRVQFTAIFLLSINMIGYGLGPVVIGILSDYVYPTHDGIRYALATVAAFIIPTAIGLLWLGIHNFGVAQARQARSTMGGVLSPQILLE
jgi:MFS family permease